MDNDKALRELGKNKKYKDIFKYLSERTRTSKSSDSYTIVRYANESGFNIEADTVRDLFLELEKLGLGATKNFGRTIAWNTNPLVMAQTALGHDDLADELLRKYRQDFDAVSIHKQMMSPNSATLKSSFMRLDGISLDLLINEINRRGFKVTLEPLNRQKAKKGRNEK